MSVDDQALIEKLKSLPPQDEQRLTRTAARASEPTFKAVWDNPEDSDYDRL